MDQALRIGCGRIGGYEGRIKTLTLVREETWLSPIDNLFAPLVQRFNEIMTLEDDLSWFALTTWQAIVMVSQSLRMLQDPASILLRLCFDGIVMACTC